MFLHKPKILIKIQKNKPFYFIGLIFYFRKNERTITKIGGRFAS